MEAVVVEAEPRPRWRALVGAAGGLRVTFDGGGGRLVPQAQGAVELAPGDDLVAGKVVWVGGAPPNAHLRAPVARRVVRVARLPCASTTAAAGSLRGLAYCSVRVGRLESCCLQVLTCVLICTGDQGALAGWCIAHDRPPALRLELASHAVGRRSLHSITAALFSTQYCAPQHARAPM